jgi:hypothetical protein
MPPEPAPYSFPQQHPGESVGEHEVYMSFRGDSDALAWHEWWRLKGEKSFQRFYLKWREKNASR